MKDILLNENFSVELNNQNDLATASDRTAFEQSVSLLLTEYMYDNVIGAFQSTNISEKINLQVSRVARKHGMIDSIKKLQVEKQRDKPNTYEVEIVYGSDDITRIYKQL